MLKYIIIMRKKIPLWNSNSNYFLENIVAGPKITFLRILAHCARWCNVTWKNNRNNVSSITSTTTSSFSKKNIFNEKFNKILVCLYFKDSKNFNLSSHHKNFFKFIGSYLFFTIRIGILQYRITVHRNITKNRIFFWGHICKS